MFGHCEAVQVQATAAELKQVKGEVVLHETEMVQAMEAELEQARAVGEELKVQASEAALHEYAAWEAKYTEQEERAHAEVQELKSALEQATTGRAHAVNTALGQAGAKDVRNTWKGTWRRAWRAGEWACLGCGAHQFASRHSCRRCRLPKPCGDSNEGADALAPSSGLARAAAAQIST